MNSPDLNIASTGAQLRDQGMAASEANPDNAEALAAARQAFEVLIKTVPEFASTDVIEACEKKGIFAKDWRCIGGLFARAARDGRICRVDLRNSRRKSRHAGDQKIWKSIEYQIQDKTAH